LLAETGYPVQNSLAYPVPIPGNEYLVFRRDREFWPVFASVYQFQTGCAKFRGGKDGFLRLWFFYGFLKKPKISKGFFGFLWFF